MSDNSPTPYDVEHENVSAYEAVATETGAGQYELDASLETDDESQGLWILAVLSTLMAFASISTDLYLPALPSMANALGAGPGQMEYTISTYLIGFSLGQLLWSPIGDRLGRRLPVAIGLILFVIGSIGCACSSSVLQVIAWRIVQATGASAGVVLGRAMVRDLYPGDRSAQMLSTLMTVMAVAPLLGPIVGGQILHVASWRAIFWSLVAIGIVTLVALYTIPETHPVERRNRAPLRHVMNQYAQLLAQPRLLGYAGAGAFYYAGMFAYIAGTPFAYITYYHVPASLYGWLFAAGIIGIMVANSLNARYVTRVGVVKLLRLGTTGALIAALVLVFDTLFDFGALIGAAAPLFVFIAMAGFVVANSIAGAMESTPEHAGAVSALVGAVQYGSGIIGSAFVGMFSDGTPRPMGWVIAVVALGGAACAWLFVSESHPKKLNDTTEA